MNHHLGALFQSTPPCGGRRWVYAFRDFVLQFQSTPPCGGRLYKGVHSDRSLMFQSTPPCGGRRLGRGVAVYSERVSIHAPVRGATQFLQTTAGKNLFQSTPPCGGRHSFYKPQPGKICFNPRPRAGGDSRSSASYISNIEFQSTPPCGGRRGRRSDGQTYHPRFNPRPRAGGDTNFVPCGANFPLFQSTPPCGGRRG